MRINATREQRRKLARDNEKLSSKFEPVPSDLWPKMHRSPLQVWRSRDYLVQLFGEIGPAEIRMTICRATLGDDGRWLADLSWDQLQKIKSDLGYGHVFAVEIYPPDQDVVNVANMRHLWLMRKPPPDLGWHATDALR